VSNRREVFLFVSTTTIAGLLPHRQCDKASFPINSEILHDATLRTRRFGKVVAENELAGDVEGNELGVCTGSSSCRDRLPTADPSSQLHRERYSERLGHFRFRVPGCIGKRLPGVATSNFNQCAGPRRIREHLQRYARHGTL